jgi:hypothetical protein
MSDATASATDRLPGAVGLLAAAIAVELSLVVVYFAVTPARVTRPLYVLVPFVWINAGLWAVYRTEIPRTTTDQRFVGAAVAAGYLLLLLWITGLLSIVTDVSPFATGLTVGTGSPGWERITLIAPPVGLVFVPYRVIGYVALAYLVYATLLETVRSAFAGAVGLLACVGCSFTVVLSFAAAVLGGSVGFATVYAHSVEFSTAAYLLAVGLLYWRPSIADLRQVWTRVGRAR